MVPLILRGILTVILFSSLISCVDDLVFELADSNFTSSLAALSNNHEQALVEFYAHWYGSTLTCFSAVQCTLNN